MRAWVLALVFVVACGAAPGQGSGPLAPPSPPIAALAAWRDFPVHANPRPIVWFSLPNLIRGFPNNDRKIAWACNKLVLADGLRMPGGIPPTATAVWPSGTRATYRAISASQAFAGISKPVDANPVDCPRAQALVITTVRVGTAGFETDRGTAQMTAWLFDIAEGSYAYPALDPSAYWNRGMGTSGGIGGRLSSDGRTLTIGLVGGPDTPGPCGVDYSAAAAESETAVAVAVSSRTHGGPNTICDLVGYGRKVVVQLAAPLGGRVLLDEKGNAGTACPENGGC
jgi:hypothetical protein